MFAELRSHLANGSSSWPQIQQLFRQWEDNMPVELAKDYAQSHTQGWPVDVDGHVRNLHGMKLVYIPAGTFMMGASKDDDYALSDEEPQRQVILTRSFVMADTPTT